MSFFKSQQQKYSSAAAANNSMDNHNSSSLFQINPTNMSIIQSTALFPSPLPTNMQLPLNDSNFYSP